MTTINRGDRNQRLASAARRIVEGGAVDAASGRFSRTVFMLNASDDRLPETVAVEAALSNGLGLVSLRTRPGSGETPRVMVALNHEGVAKVTPGCVLWQDEVGGPVLMVPFDASDDFHFAVGDQGLELRAGRPAEHLGRGMARAGRRLEKVARELRSEELSRHLRIVTGPLAA